MIDLATAEELAAQLRVDSIRSSTSAGSGHPTSSMSAADILAVLVGRHLRYDWDRPGADANDHLIFSKGHASPLLYSVLQGRGSDLRRGADDRIPALRVPPGGSPHAGSALGRRRHRIARPGAARRRRGRAGRPLPRPASLPRVGAVRRQRDGRGLHLGGPRQGVVLRAGQPGRDRRRQPPGPARADRAPVEPQRLRPPRRGVRRACADHRRARHHRDRPGAGRGQRRERHPADGDPRPYGQGTRVPRGRGPRGLARQALPQGHGDTGDRRARRRTPPARPRPAARALGRRRGRHHGGAGGPAVVLARREGRDPQGLRRRARGARRPESEGRRARRRGRQLHLRGGVRQGLPGPLLRDVHRRTAARRLGRRPRRAALRPLRRHVRRVLHPRVRLHPDGRHLTVGPVPGRLARGRGDRRRRAVPDGLGGPGDDAGRPGLDGPLSERRHEHRRPRTGHGRHARHHLHADHARRLPGPVRGGRALPGRRGEGPAVRPVRRRDPHRRRCHRAPVPRRRRPARRGRRPRPRDRPVLGQARRHRHAHRRRRRTPPAGSSSPRTTTPRAGSARP